MNSGTHLILSWGIAEMLPVKNRDKQLIAWAGLLPDLDGLGVLADVVNGWFGQPSFGPDAEAADVAEGVLEHRAG